MKRLGIVLALAGVLLAAGCGSGAKPGTHETGTLAGVGVAMSGSPPRPSTPAACVRRWNSAANVSGRSAALRRAPKAKAALVRRAEASGYFRAAAGRCLVYLVARRSVVVLVEAARGRFAFTADASGRFSANADLRAGGRLRLR